MTELIGPASVKKHKEHEAISITAETSGWQRKSPRGCGRDLS